MLYFARWKTILIWLVVLAGVVVAAPNLVSQERLAGLPDWLPKRQMTLGLDLQGGVHLLLEIDRDDIVEERLRTVESDVRQYLREAGIGLGSLGHPDSMPQPGVRRCKALADGHGGRTRGRRRRQTHRRSVSVPDEV